MDQDSCCQNDINTKKEYIRAARDYFEKKKIRIE